MTSLAVPPPQARSASGDDSRTAETTRLFEAHSERVLAYCLRRLGSRAEAEDAVQMTFLYAFRALQRGVVPESESAWLFAIAKNVCRWQRRTLSRRGSLSSDKDLDGFAGLDASDGDHAGLCHDLKEALKAIPASQRRALVLREWHGLPTSEVATRLELSTPATYALLTRARRSFVAAFTARREALQSVQLWMLVSQLKLQVKAFFGSAVAKAAVAAVTVVGAGVGGVAVVEEIRGGPAGPPAASVVEVDPADAGTVSPVSTSSSGGAPSVAPARGRAETRAETPGGATAPSTGDAPQQAPVPTGGPDRASDPTATPPPTGTDVPSVPAPELPPAVPVDPPPLPGLGLPEDLLPPLEPPPLPPLPPLEPLEELPPLPPPLDVPLPELPPLPPLP